MSGKAVLLKANALDLPLADSSVDLIVTSPPYFALRSYQDGGEHYEGQLGAEATPAEFVNALITATSEMVRVLKPSGSIFVNLGDKYAPGKSLMGIPWRYALRCIDDLGLILRAEIIWAKPNGLPDPTKDRIQRKHEQWLHFVTQPDYFANLEAIRIPLLAPAVQGHSSNMDLSRGDHDMAQRVMGDTARGKIPGSWWAIPTQPLKVPKDLGVDHFAAFPTEWPRRLILGWSPPAAVVLDPFGGTGTTAAVAKALGRTGISVDLSADYLRLAGWRCNGDGYSTIYSKVHDTETVNKPITGQGVLQI